MKKLLLAISIGSSFALAAPVFAAGNQSSGGYGQQGMSGGFNQQGTSNAMDQQAGGFGPQTSGSSQQGSVGYDQQGMSGGFNPQGTSGGFNQQGGPGAFDQQAGGFNQQGSVGFDQQSLPPGIYQEGSSGEFAVVNPPATSGAMTSGAMGQQQGNNPAMQGKRAVMGQVVDMREVQLQGTNTKHRLVKIRNPQGQNMVVDLGDASRAPGNDFRKGTNIVAIGKESRINGEPVLFARYVGDLQQAGGIGMRRQ